MGNKLPTSYDKAAWVLRIHPCTYRTKIKMNRKQIAFGLVALLAIVMTLWVFVSATLSWFLSLDKSIAAALIPALLGLLGLAYVQWHSKTRDIAESHRTSKIEVYNTFFDIVEKYQDGSIDETELVDGNLPDWLRRDYSKLNRGLILWASPGVISAWLKFRMVSATGGDILLTMDHLYQAIRKDLGNSNSGLRSGDLIRIGLKDPNEMKL